MEHERPVSYPHIEPLQPWPSCSTATRFGLAATAARCLIPFAHFTMHFAFPPRKNSHPPPYANRSSRSTSPLFRLRRSRLQNIAVCAVGLTFVIWLFLHILGPMDRTPSGVPRVVIVSVIDPEGYSDGYIHNIKENRLQYAKRHGESPREKKSSIHSGPRRLGAKS